MVLIIVILILIFFFLLVRGDLLFNILNEFFEKYKFVKGFNIILKNFSSGKIFFVMIYLKVNKNLVILDVLFDIEKIIEILSR